MVDVSQSIVFCLCDIKQTKTKSNFRFKQLISYFLPTEAKDKKCKNSLSETVTRAAFASLARESHSCVTRGWPTRTPTRP